MKRLTLKKLSDAYSAETKCSESDVLVAQLCPSLSDPTGCSPPGSSVHGILQAGRLESIPFLWGIFPTQGLNPGLLHCRSFTV